MISQGSYLGISLGNMRKDDNYVNSLNNKTWSLNMLIGL